MKLSSSLKGVAPHASMVLNSFISSIYIFLSKVIMVQGVSATVFITYQFFLSTLSLAILAFIFERKRAPPTMKIVLEIFFVALIGQTFDKIMFTTALYFVPSTIEYSALNMCPAITYIICLIMQQEKLQLQTLWGSGKMFGTLISISGAFCLLFWHQSSGNSISINEADWAVGLVLLAAGAVATSIWYIMLGSVARRYPAEMSLTAIMMFFATIQTGVVAAVMNHEASQWQLNWSLELINIVIGGTLATGLSPFLSTWCAGIKGPVFVSSFSPLGVLFTTILEFIFLRHGMNIGSVFGSILIVLGLYMYLWSKYKEEKAQDIADADSEITTSLLG